jgi:hypothetical protein
MGAEELEAVVADIALHNERAVPRRPIPCSMVPKMDQHP